MPCPPPCPGLRQQGAFEALSHPFWRGAEFQNHMCNPNGGTLMLHRGEIPRTHGSVVGRLLKS